MMTLQIPALLALLGTALLTIAIFAPRRQVAGDAGALVSPVTSPVVERWVPPHAAVEPDPGRSVVAPRPIVPEQPAWPALVDPRAVACDVSVRLDLVEALAHVHTPWAGAILQRALEDETDDRVRAAIRSACASPASPTAAIPYFAGTS